VTSSGQGVAIAIANTECTAPVTLLGFEVPCNWSGPADVDVDSDGTAQWVCPYCHTLHETTADDLGIGEPPC
jgi:hypothetical protein